MSMRLPIISNWSWDEIHNLLVKQNLQVYLADAHSLKSTSIYQTDFTSPTAIVVGSEGHGLSKQVRSDGYNAFLNETSVTIVVGAPRSAC